MNEINTIADILLVLSFPFFLYLSFISQFSLFLYKSFVDISRWYIVLPPSFVYQHGWVWIWVFLPMLRFTFMYNCWLLNLRQGATIININICKLRMVISNIGESWKEIPKFYITLRAKLIHKAVTLLTDHTVLYVNI